MLQCCRISYISFSFVEIGYSSDRTLKENQNRIHRMYGYNDVLLDLKKKINKNNEATIITNMVSASLLFISKVSTLCRFWMIAFVTGTKLCAEIMCIYRFPMMRGKSQVNAFIFHTVTS